LRPVSSGAVSQSERMLSVAFGAVTLNLAADDGYWLEHARIRFGSAIGHGRSAFELWYQSNDEPLPFPGSPRSAFNEPVRITPRVGGCRVTGATFVGEIDFEAGRANVRGPAALYPAEHVIRQWLPMIYPDRGLIFHSAFVMQSGAGWLAVGQSGAGKSTLARLAGDNAVADESNAVRYLDGQWRVESLPFASYRPGAATLAGIVTLDERRRGVHATRRLDPAEAVRELCRHIWWPMASATHRREALDRLTALVLAVPVYALSFRPDTAVFNLLTEAA